MLPVLADRCKQYIRLFLPFLIMKHPSPTTPTAPETPERKKFRLEEPEEPSSMGAEEWTKKLSSAVSEIPGNKSALESIIGDAQTEDQLVEMHKNVVEHCQVSKNKMIVMTGQAHEQIWQFLNE
ncbi:hypothetical protein AGABI2DRAFT_121443 [Agaricus bisporus var. bisporus H97]|uniref:hypothetical protein n=1 Tax=Agaricus bisporus var. bisporus (strain H97 / ATCC MYA-4626 / FGSC 10389) TaxID=936046 RepID=UPI00029F5E7E|nr:hypothetical protein AGABI2DRAFT_121443 [Agaricus bisporus var. bisporus H97]EKV44267.1 hypothetical protein AGABI2DRAFT_121443 [Agaricus bisporus var. bisporus H97]